MCKPPSGRNAQMRTYRKCGIHLRISAQGGSAHFTSLDCICFHICSAFSPEVHLRIWQIWYLIFNKSKNTQTPHWGKCAKINHIINHCGFTHFPQWGVCAFFDLLNIRYHICHMCRCASGANAEHIWKQIQSKLVKCTDPPCAEMCRWIPHFRYVHICAFLPLGASACL